MNLNKQNLINKIKYRSQYRGTKEMDKFVNLFVNKMLNDLNIDELEQLNKLIHYPGANISHLRLFWLHDLISAGSGANLCLLGGA